MELENTSTEIHIIIKLHTVKVKTLDNLSVKGRNKVSHMYECTNVEKINFNFKELRIFDSSMDFDPQKESHYPDIGLTHPGFKSRTQETGAQLIQSGPKGKDNSAN